MSTQTLQDSLRQSGCLHRKLWPPADAFSLQIIPLNNNSFSLWTVYSRKAKKNKTADIRGKLGDAINFKLLTALNGEEE